MVTTVVADVFLGDVLICPAAASCAFEIDHSGTVGVSAPGYHDWVVELVSAGADQSLSGPVKLVPLPGVSG